MSDQNTPNTPARRRRRPAPEITPRCLSLAMAGFYLGVCPAVIQGLIYTGQLAVVKVPVQTDPYTKRWVQGELRRVLIDIRDLDALVDRSKTFVGDGMGWIAPSREATPDRKWMVQ